MKIVRRGALRSAGTPALPRAALAEAGFGEVERRGDVRPEDVWDGFVSKVVSFIDPAEIGPLRVVVDAANGMAGVMLPPVLDGYRSSTSFAATSSRTEASRTTSRILLPENRAFIVAKVREEQADLGVAYDGDADRCFFVDDTGEFVPGDFVTALLAAAMLETSPGEKVIYDVRASRAVPGRSSAQEGPARQPGRARVHQATDAEGGRALRRRGLGPLLLP